MIDGVDMLITCLALIALLIIGLYVSWRREDRERRAQRLWERSMR